MLGCLLVSVSLCACATDNAIPDLSEQEMQMVEEYAAHLLLKYDENYRAATIAKEEVEAERARLKRLAEVKAQIAQQKAQEKEQEQEGEQGSGEEGEGPSSEGGEKQSGPVYTDIDDFFGIDGVEIDFTSFDISKTYPTEVSENDWQGVVTATSGNSLLVFNYTLTNTGVEDKAVDMTAYSPRFTFRVNNSFSKASMMTVLLNDLSGYREVIPAGGSDTAVLLIEVTEAQAASISSLTMIMRSGESRGELTIL